MTPPLGSAGGGGVEIQPIHHACRKKLAEDTQDISVSNALGNTIENEVVRDVIEASLDVGVNDPFEPVGMSLTESLNRLVRIAARTEAKRELREVRLEDGFKDGANHFLSDPVSDGGNAQRTKFAVPFRDEDPAQGRGVVAASVFEVKHQGGKIVVQVGLESANADLIYPGGSAIAFDRLEGSVQSVKVNQPGERVEFRQLVGQ